MTENDPLEQALARIGETFDGLDDTARLDAATQTCDHLAALLSEIGAGRLDADASFAGRLDGAVWALRAITEGRSSSGA